MLMSILNANDVTRFINLLGIAIFNEMVSAFAEKGISYRNNYVRICTVLISNDIKGGYTLWNKI